MTGGLADADVAALDAAAAAAQEAAAAAQAAAAKAVAAATEAAATSAAKRKAVQGSGADGAEEPVGAARRRRWGWRREADDASSDVSDEAGPSAAEGQGEGGLDGESLDENGLRAKRAGGESATELSKDMRAGEGAAAERADGQGAVVEAIVEEQAAAKRAVAMEEVATRTKVPRDDRAAPSSTSASPSGDEADDETDDETEGASWLNEELRPRGRADDIVPAGDAAWDSVRPGMRRAAVLNEGREDLDARGRAEAAARREMEAEQYIESRLARLFSQARALVTWVHGDCVEIASACTSVRAISVADRI